MTIILSSTRRLLKKTGLVLFIALYSGCAFGQIDSTSHFQNYFEELIQQFFERSESSGDFQQEDRIRELEYLINSPLNINTATEDDLEELIFLNPLQIKSIIHHRKTYGDLISTYELMSVANLDLETARLLGFLITTGSLSKNYNVPISEMLKSGHHISSVKWRRTLEQRRGYIPNEDGVTPYLGDPNRLFFRHEYRFENRLKVSISGEKDPGEPFLKSGNEQGFDFYSGYVHLREYKSWLKDLVIGDYAANFGQGLIVGNAFGAGKSAYVTDIKQGGREIRPYNSINEFNLFRGVASSFRLHDHFELTTFASYKNVDALVFTLPIDDTFEPEEIASTIIQDGFHRTELEMNKKGQVNQHDAGVHLSAVFDNFEIALNSVYTKYDVEVSNIGQNNLLNNSLEFALDWNGIHFFSETARSRNGSMAYLAGALMSLDPRIDLAVAYRNYDIDYQSVYGSSFGEFSSVSNEKGVYLGLEIRPHKRWTISLYHDYFHRPLPSFRADAPYRGSEHFIKIKYYEKRKRELFLQYRYEKKAVNAQQNVANINVLAPTHSHRIRLHFNNKISKSLESRSRVEYTLFSQESNRTTGFLAYQDFLFKTLNSPLSFSCRLAIFDTDDFDTRIYTFENDLTYEYSSPFFTDRGLRYYLNLRYNIGYNSQFEFRIAQTRYQNRDSISSGNQQIDTNHFTQLKAQFQTKF